MANVVNAQQLAPGNTVVLASAARTATPDTYEWDVSGEVQSITLVTNTSASSTPSTVPKIEGVDRTSGAVWTLLAGSAITANGVSTLTVGPGLTASANSVAGLPVPRVIRVTFTHGNANSHTYSANIIANP